jgi:hypothetical protein
MAENKFHFMGNVNLRPAGRNIELSEDQLSEYKKCRRDPVYFIENYVKVVSLDKGVVPMKLYPYQKRLIKAFHENRFVLSKLFRQAGKSTITAAYVLWYVNFNANKNAAILANKAAIAREIFSRVQFMFEELPVWMKKGVKEWNKTSFTLENDTVCFCAASSPSSIRGKSISLLVLDEFAFLSQNLADEFIASVFPTISSGQSTKMIIVSTPHGMNHFYKMWVEAEQGLNGFVPISGEWKEHPDRTQAWADDMRAKLGEVKYTQEILVAFLGSSNTLIPGSKLSTLTFKQPTILLKGLNQYYKPEEGRNYVMLVDVSRGTDQDYSAFIIIDITEMPYKVVCTYRDNQISTLAFPELIYNVATKYNNSFILVETNDLGQQVADDLYYDLEYENVYMSSRDDIREGGGKSYSPGCRTTKKTKQIGCNTIRNIIEQDQLEINDSNIVDEMSTFVRVGATYKAEEGKHDDMMMCLVMFGYLTTTPAFQDLFDFSLRRKLVQDQITAMEEQMLPIGFFSRDDDVEEIIVDKRGNNLWLGNGDMDEFSKRFSA